MSFRYLFLLPLLSFHFVLHAASVDSKKMGAIANLEMIKYLLDVQYAPKEWKEIHNGWNLEEEKEIAKQKVLELKEVKTKDTQKIIKQFLMSAKDYHVGIVFYSTESATLPFTIRGAQGRYFISWINTEHLSKTVFPFSIGDEILSFADKPIHQVVEEMKREYGGMNQEKTDQTLAERYVTERRGAIGFSVPKGPVTVQLLHRGESKPKTYQLIWNYQPEKIFEEPKLDPILHSFEKNFSEDVLLIGGTKMKAGFFSGKRCSQKTESPPWVSREGFLPPLGKLIWKTNPYSLFHAYLYENEQGNKIGYIRIPTYEGVDLHAEEFGKIIARFEEEADALVVDQMDNPGGYVSYMYALSSMLTDTALKTPKHRFALTQEIVAKAFEELAFFESIRSEDEAKVLLAGIAVGYPPSYQMARFYVEYLYFLIHEWNLGHLLTDPIHVEGVDYINPHPRYRFTKPIVVLINEMCFSGGDFFPAIMQDNKRALIFGSRTAGAGGVINILKYPNQEGIDCIALTGSIAERVNKNPIENLGVVPDEPYSVQPEDFESDFSCYANALNQTILSLLSSEKMTEEVSLKEAESYEPVQLSCDSCPPKVKKITKKKKKK